MCEMPNTMTLERAIAIAAEAHQGVWQNDKADNLPYILHPLTLMMQMHTPATRMAAVLHDVIEDCDDWTFERLETEGCPPDVMEAIRLLTHLEPEPKFKTKRNDETLNEFFQRLEHDYLQYVTRLADNSIARMVKWSDLRDNIGDGYPTRECDRKDRPQFDARMQRYHKAKEILIDHWPQDPTHPSAGRFCDSGLGEFMSNWSVTDKDGNPVDIPTAD
jgi:hypothetical protein